MIEVCTERIAEWKTIPKPNSWCKQSKDFGWCTIKGVGWSGVEFGTENKIAYMIDWTKEKGKTMGGNTISALHLHPPPKRKGGELKCSQTGLESGLVIVKGS